MSFALINFIKRRFTRKQRRAKAIRLISVYINVHPGWLYKWNKGVSTDRLELVAIRLKQRIIN